DNNNAPPVSAFPNVPLSFKKIRDMSSLGKYPSFTGRTIGVSNLIRTPSFRLFMSMSAQQSAFTVGVLFDLYVFYRSTENPLYLYLLVFDGGLKKPPTYALRLIIPNNTCILCITAAAGTNLVDAYSPDIVISSSLGKEVHNPVADHPIGPATDHCLSKLLPHQLTNQTRAPPGADSSFCSSAYGVLAAVSSCCSPPKDSSLRVTHPSATGNTTSRLTCMC
ncbi:hypothetical protein ES319_D10G141200v1, partial [Gossypium barbadense]